MEPPAASPSAPPIERTLVRIGSYVMIGVGCLGAVNNLVLGLDPLTTGMLCFAALAGAALVAAERRGVDTTRIAEAFMATTTAALIASWMPAGGVRSSVSTVVAILAAVGILMLPIRAARPFLVALVAVILGLVGLEWQFPALASPLPGRAVALVDSTMAALVAVVMIGLSTLSMRRVYEHDRDELERTSASLKAAHAELAAALEVARAANDAKSRFLANMSHELRTPLAGVVGRLELLGAQRLEPTTGAHVEAIRRSTTHLRGLIDDLLDLGRIERDDFVLASNPVRLATLVADVCDDTGGDGAPAVVGVVDPAMPEAVVADAMRLRQIATNLVANAVRHARAQRIELRVEPAGPERLRIVVTDDGEGIPDDVLPNLFDPFVRGDESPALGGLGLGLYVVRRLVDAMGGTLEVTSSQLGARFTVTLPYEPLRLTPAPAHDTEAPLQPGLRVLSAEDDGTMRVMLEAMFDELGVDATLVADGLAAVDRASEGSYDAIFLDLHMPRLDGPAAAARIVADYAAQGRPLPRLVALTANAYAADIATCQRAGMTHFLAKPIVLADLRRALGGLQPASA